MQEIGELLEAITALEAQRGILGDRVVDAALAPLEEKLNRMEEQHPTSRQRRLVTVVFVDLVNSTLLSQGLEPEEVMEVMGGALRRLAKSIKAFGGEVTQVIGDEIMAVFGLNRVQENDARQAVRAGLAILAESKALASELEQRYKISGFNIRIGMNTGRVVAGKFTNIESTVMGLAVSLAARMEDAAEPGTMVVSQFTYQHIRGAFEVEVLPPVIAKGFPQPIGLFKIVSARPRTFRTVTRGVEGAETRLIGRENELDHLKQILYRTFKNHETQVVTILGEAGVGKSRLLYEFDRWIARTMKSIVAFKARISPQMSVIPYSLIREMLSYRFNLLTTDTVIVTHKKFVDGLSKHLDDEIEMKAQFIEALLGFKFSESKYLKAIAHDPKQISERALIYLKEFFVSLASKTNTIFMLDDIHWADQPSIEFISLLYSESLRLKLMIVCLARPNINDHYPNWWITIPAKQFPSSALKLPHTQLNLAPLTYDDSQVLLKEILGETDVLPIELREKILSTSDGNPYYVEEFIQSLIDIGAIQKNEIDGTWKIFLEKVNKFEIPSTLTALLEARIDNLNVAQRSLVLQASVIGQVFWRSALQAIHNYEPVIDEDLKELTKRGFIYRQEESNIEGTDEYRFHHSLLRDVAYQAMVKADRKSYHALIADWLIGATQAYSKAREYEPVIAEHYELAENTLLAVDWFTRSGASAYKQGAPKQGLAFYDRALSLMTIQVNHDETTIDLMRQWKALLGRDEVLGMLGDTERRMGDDQALVSLAQNIGDDHLLAEAYYRMGYFLGLRGLYKQERDAYQLGLEAEKRVDDHKWEALILSLKGISEARLGEIEVATKTVGAALSCTEHIDDDLILAQALSNISTFFGETGDIGRMAEMQEKQNEIFHRTGDLRAEIMGLNNLGWAYSLLGLPEEAISVLRECINLANKVGNKHMCAYGGLNLALAYLRFENKDAAMSELIKCLPELKNLNDTFGHAVGKTYYGLVAEQLGEINEALDYYMQSSDELQDISTPGYRLDAQTGIARCLLAKKELEEAEKYATIIWNYLQQSAGRGMEFPILAYETCANIYFASGQEKRAWNVLEAGYLELSRRADRISMQNWRESFLNGVPEHRRMLIRWQERRNSNIMVRGE